MILLAREQTANDQLHTGLDRSMALEIKVIPHRPSDFVVDNQTRVAIVLPVPFTRRQSECRRTCSTRNRSFSITDLLRGKFMEWCLNNWNIYSSITSLESKETSYCLPTTMNVTKI